MFTPEFNRGIKKTPLIPIESIRHGLLGTVHGHWLHEWLLIEWSNGKISLAKRKSIKIHYIKTHG